MGDRFKCAGQDGDGLGGGAPCASTVDAPDGCRSDPPMALFPGEQAAMSRETRRTIHGKTAPLLRKIGTRRSMPIFILVCLLGMYSVEFTMSI